MDPRLPKLLVATDLSSSDYDCIVVVAPTVAGLSLEKVKGPLESYVAVDKSGEGGIFVVPCDLPAKKIVFSGTGALDNDHDDVRGYATAAKVRVMDNRLN